MKSKYIFKTNVKVILVFTFFISVFYACKETEFSENYDINWPVPKITSFTNVKEEVGKTITITGSDFEKITAVNIGTPATQASIVSSTATSIVVRVPRLVNAGPISVSTAYKRTTISDESFTPIYLNTTVNVYPSRIIKGQAFTIRGSNMDMVTEVEVAGHKIGINAASGAATDALLVPTIGLILPATVIVKVTKAKASITNGVSGQIPVQEPSLFFTPVQPIILFDFEDNINPYVASGTPPTTVGLNLSGAPKGRGQKYLTVTRNPATTNWVLQGEIKKTGTIDLSAFHKPAFTALVNTRGKGGYFQVEIVDESGTVWGIHFKPANSSYTYRFVLPGWTYVSVELNTANLEKWSGSGTSFNPNGKLRSVALQFATGNAPSNVGPDWEVNVDQVMITDGQVKSIFKAFDFEDNVNPYVANGANGAITGLNLSGIATNNGDKYLTVRKSGVPTFQWTGDIMKSGPINLSTVTDPHINFWMNTNGKRGFVQIETNQANVKWGASMDVANYFVQTTGWKLYSIRMADLAFSKWGGTGTATSLELKASLDYIRIAFSTGNVTGEYEVNIDDVYISDGPMF